MVDTLLREEVGGGGSRRPVGASSESPRPREDTPVVGLGAECGAAADLDRPPGGSARERGRGRG